MCCIRSPITSRELSFSLRAPEMQSTSPRGEPNRHELDGSTNREPGNISLVPRWFQLISDFWVFRHNPFSARDSMTSKSCPISAAEPPRLISRYRDSMTSKSCPISAAEPPRLISRYITHNLAEQKVQWW